MNGYGCGLCGKHLKNFEYRWMHIQHHGKENRSRDQWSYQLEFKGLLARPSLEEQNRVLVRDFNPKSLPPGKLAQAKKDLERKDIFKAPIDSETLDGILARQIPVNPCVWPKPHRAALYTPELIETGPIRDEAKDLSQSALMPATNYEPTPHLDPRLRLQRGTPALSHGLARVDQVLYPAEPTYGPATQEPRRAISSNANQGPFRATSLNPTLLELHSPYAGSQSYSNMPSTDASSSGYQSAAIPQHHMGSATHDTREGNDIDHNVEMDDETDAECDEDTGVQLL